MEQYYVILNNKEYELPLMVIGLNQDVLNKYKLIKDNKNYLDIERMEKEQKLDELREIEYQCTMNIQQIAIESQGQIAEKWNKMTPKLNFLDDMVKIHAQKQEQAKAFEKIKTSMQMSLEFKNEIKNQELLEEPHYVQIEGIDYELPMSLMATNSEVFNQYTKEETDKVYLDIEKMIQEDKKEQLKSIAKELGKMTISYLNEEGVNTKDISTNLKSMEAMTNIYFNKQEKEKAYEKIKESMKLSLELQKELQEHQNITK